MSEATRILDAIGQGNLQAAEELFPIVYDELRQLAAQKMAQEPAGQTLQPTALVHEVWLRLVGNETPRFETRGHFFAAAAEAMRRILIERARRKQSLKRGAGLQFEQLDLEHADVAVRADDTTLLLVDEALAKLAGEDAAAAQLIKLRFFAGMTNQEAGRALGVSERTAKRHWTFARAWLYDEIRRQMSA
jgi:RNA polymerase sigma factor (TIGR02999 family)